MLLFIDGFDHYATTDIAKKWDSIRDNVSIESASGRRGGGCMRFGGLYPSVTKNVPATSSFVIGFAFNPSSLSGGPWRLAALLDGGTVQCSLVVNLDSTLSVVRGTSTAVTGGTSTATISTGAYVYVEWKVTIADSITAGSCEVRINGVTAITVATGQDLKETTNATANQVQFGTAAFMPSLTHDFDDLYVCDNSGSVNNDFLGDVRIDTIYPNGAGTHQDWTPSSGSDHAALVDEAAPNTTDYLTGGGPGTKETLALSDLALNGAILGVQVNNAVAKSDAGASAIRNLIRSAGTDANGPVVALGTGYTCSSSIHEVDPATSAAWLTAGINALEAGAEVIY